MNRSMSGIFFLVTIFAVTSLITNAENPSSYYNEFLRPQFHFSAEKNWLNDPNGLVFYQGEYHLFYQHNPFENEWGFMHWGHAVSGDLVHWKHLPIAIDPDEGSKDKAKCTAFSGSAAVDENNSSGLQKGSEKTLVVFYTSWQCGQRMAYSNDGGRTWTKYEGNPVIPLANDDARDPRIFWHKPSQQWVIALYRRPDNDESKNGVSFYVSTNLKQWRWTSHIVGFFECPDIFELPVAGEKEAAKWILLGGDGEYMIGSFDGKEFHQESGKHVLDYGANFYASQTWNGIPEADGRRIQIAWMRGGKYPDSSFNQQMSFPCQLTLRQTEEGLQVYREPVEEIASLYEKTQEWKHEKLVPGKNLLAGIEGDLFEIQGEFSLPSAAQLGLRVRKGDGSEGFPIVYDAQKAELSCLGKTAPMQPVDGKIKMRILLDRSSIEVFGNDGRVSMSSCFVPGKGEELEIFAHGGEAEVVELAINKLKSAWRE